MRPLRRLMARLEAPSSSSPSGQTDEKPKRQSVGGVSGPSARASACPVVGLIEPQDMQEAMAVTKASARQFEKKYAQFSEDYGQLGS